MSVLSCHEMTYQTEKCCILIGISREVSGIRNILHNNLE